MKRNISVLFLTMLLVLPQITFADAKTIFTDSFEAVVKAPDTSGKYENDLFKYYSSGIDCPWGKTLDTKTGLGYDSTVGLKVSNSGVANTSAGQRRGAWLSTRNVTADAENNVMLSYKVKVNQIPADTSVTIGGLSSSANYVARITSGKIEAVTYNSKDQTLNVVNAITYEKNKWLSIEMKIDGAKTTEWTYCMDFVVLNDKNKVLMSVNELRVAKHNNVSLIGLAIIPFHINHYGTSTSIDYDLAFDDFKLVQYQNSATPTYLGCTVSDNSVNVPRNETFVFKYDLDASRISDCVVTKEGNPLDSSLYSVKTCVANKQIVFNQLLERNCNYAITLSDAGGNTTAQLNFKTENMHEIGLSITSVEDESGTAVHKPKQGSLKINYEIKDPLHYTSASGLVMAALYKDNEMVWMDFVTFSNEPLVNGKAELSANFVLPAVESNCRLKLMLFDYENFLCPVNSGIEWN